MVIYFQSEEGYHELLEDTPARDKLGQLVLLKDCNDWQGPIEVYLDGSWVKGERCGRPTEHRFTLSVVSFDDELTVAREVQAALGKLRQNHGTSLHWFKFTKEEK